MSAISHEPAPMPPPMPPWSPFGAAWQERQQPGRAPVFARCRGCCSWIWPAQPFCSRCLGEECDWGTTSGRGRLLSAVTLHRGMAADGGWPSGWTVGLVAMEEGPCVWVHLGRVPPSDRDEPVLLAVARDRRGRHVLIAAQDPDGLEAVSSALSGLAG